MGSERHIYEFGSFRIDAVKRVLFRDGQPVPLTSKSLDTLLMLVEHRGRVVAKDDLMKALWPDSIVEENNLTQQISMLRKVLGEKVNEHRYVVTVPGRGYSFVADVRSDRNAVRMTGDSVAADRSWRTRGLLFSCLGVAALSLLLFGFSWHRANSTGQRDARRSIAVLPFKPINTDPSDVYLSTGMADALIARLSNLGQISVRPTSAIIKYAGQARLAQAIGRELGVDSVLEGTVQKAGARVRVTVQLVSVQDGSPIWAETFDQQMTDIFGLQDAISEQVARTMMVRLNGDDRKQIRKHPTENVAAYQAYLEGRHFWNRRDTEGLTKSLEHFQRAIDLDAHYAQAYSGLADAYTLLVAYQVDAVPPKEAARKAKDAAVRALALDESLAEAHASLAMIKTYEHDQPGAETEFRRAIELNPQYATAYHWYSEFLTMNDREEEAIAAISRAHEIDPLSAVISTTLGEHLYYARRYDEAIAQLRKTLDLSPDFGTAHFMLGLALEQKGLFEAAIAELQRAKATAALDRAAGASLAHSYALAGRLRDARRVLVELLASKSAAPYEIAVVYQGLGEREQVFDWLEKIEDTAGEINRLLRCDPRLDSLRAEPRFQNLLRPRSSRGA